MKSFSASRVFKKSLFRTTLLAFILGETMMSPSWATVTCSNIWGLSGTEGVSCGDGTEVTLTVSDEVINVTTTNEYGVIANNWASGGVTINITDTSIDRSSPAGTSMHGIFALRSNVTGISDANINMISTGSNSISLSGAASDTAVLIMNLGPGNSNLNVSGDWHISSDSPTPADFRDGLEAEALDGIATVIHTGSGIIFTNGGNGVLANGATGANVEIASGVTITMDNTVSGYANNNAIKALSTAGDARVVNAAELITHGNNVNGIHVVSVGTATITNSGAISSDANNSQGIFAQGIGAVAVSNTGSIVMSGEDSRGIYANSVSTSSVLVQNDVQGGWGINSAAIATAGTSQTLNNFNNVSIGALNDRAVTADLGVSGSFHFTNNGSVTGSVNAQTSDVTFDNNGLWHIRHYADTDGDGIRDTVGIAISNLGTSGNNTITNNGTIELLGDDGGATNLDTTGIYLPFGNTHNAIAAGGPAQAQILGATSFTNNGLIDLTSNGATGDVFVISGGSTAGMNGGGKYVSNGGTIKLDTYLNGGGANSQSDMLVLDNVTIGTGGATQIYITPAAGSPGGATTDDGITLIEVKGTSAQGAFVLGSPVMYGAYEYVLGNGTGANAQNWYLQNFSKSKELIINPNAGAYLGNQFVAANMFYHNILDRRDNVRSPDQTLWVRTNYSNTETRLFNGRQHADIDTGIIQLGADVFKKDDIVAGVFAGYGHASVKSTSRQTDTSANGGVTGYQVGVYGSWMPEQDKGPYADVWAHYAWYDNKLSGQAQQGESKNYCSWGYALSAEIGYSLEVAKKENGSAWIVEPHAQIIYSRIDVDSFYDHNNARYNGNNALGIQTRIGARIYGQKPAEEEGLTPFVEANWLHNAQNNAVRLDGTRLSSVVGKNVGEIKVGVQGQLTKRLSAWGHMGGQYGSQHYRQHSIQVGLGWQW